jgi:hypothetical protein
MSAFPNFSNLADFVQTALNGRRDNTIGISGLNCWVRAASAVTPITKKDTNGNAVSFGSNGLMIYSNPNFGLFKAAGDPNVATIYGDSSHSGTVGVTWDGKAVAAGIGLPGRPSPIITNFVVDEGSGNISRKAEFTIRCFTVEQLEVIAAHYLEPGFTVFLEWGWNTSQGVATFSSKLSPDKVAQYQSFEVVNKRRAASSGNADIFLGFITGGSISISDAFWDVQIKATGFTELPAYFMAADNVLTADETKAASGGTPVVKKSLDFGTMDISYTTDLNKKRFKMAFNELPSNRKTQLVKNLINDPEVANAANFINFDTAVADHVNSSTEGHWYKTTKVKAGNTDVKVADGTKLIGPERFIRFGTLMKIMNTIAVKAYKIGGEDVKYQVFTNNTVISSFNRIFSTDKSKLFIPNPNTPKLDFGQAIKEGGQVEFANVTDSSVKNGATTIKFPESDTIAKGAVGGRTLVYVNADASNKIEGLDKEAYKWGYLDNLYVNFDFVKGILETKNFLIKDALYQILNGMSSAAGSIWDFQIVDTVAGPPDPKDPNAPAAKRMFLQVVDMNFVSNTTEKERIYTFELQGTKSIFMDASFDMNIGGAIMNQVIGNRLSTSSGKKGIKQNNALPSYEGKLFSNDYADLVLKQVEEQKAVGADAQKANDAANTPATPTDATEEAKKQQEKDFAVFLNKIALYPKVDKTDKDAEFGADPYKANYLAAYNDSQLFESLKMGEQYLDQAAGKQTSILLPIKFTFTIHGISGIKRGDKFKVNGLPSKYSTGGFFQVMSVKHTLEGMLWKTEIGGGFRQSRS